MSRLDYAAIGRVLAFTADDETPIPELYRQPSVGARKEVWDQARDARASLSGQISWAFEKLDLIEELGSEVAAKRRYDALGKISKSLKAIETILKEEPTTRSSLSRHLSFDSHWNSGALDAFEELRGAADQERRRLRYEELDVSAPLKELRDAGLGNKPALIKSLAEIYSRVFEGAPSVKYNSLWETDGPFLRFAEVILLEMGEPAKRETIRRYWDRSKEQDKGSNNS